MYDQIFTNASFQDRTDYGDTVFVDAKQNDIFACGTFVLRYLATHLSTSYPYNTKKFTIEKSLHLLRGTPIDVHRNQTALVCYVFVLGITLISVFGNISENKTIKNSTYVARMQIQL